MQLPFSADGPVGRKLRACKMLVSEMEERRLFESAMNEPGAYSGVSLGILTLAAAFLFRHFRAREGGVHEQQQPQVHPQELSRSGMCLQSCSRCGYWWNCALGRLAYGLARL